MDLVIDMLAAGAGGVPPGGALPPGALAAGRPSLLLSGGERTLAEDEEGTLGLVEQRDGLVDVAWMGQGDGWGGDSLFPPVNSDQISSSKSAISCSSALSLKRKAPPIQPHPLRPCTGTARTTTSSRRSAPRPSAAASPSSSLGPRPSRAAPAPPHTSTARRAAPTRYIHPRLPHPLSRADAGWVESWGDGRGAERRGGERGRRLRRRLPRPPPGVQAIDKADPFRPSPNRSFVLHHCVDKVPLDVQISRPRLAVHCGLARLQ